MALNFISAQDAAEQIKNGDSIGLSGFTASGTPKVVTEALAEIAVKEHEAGREFKVNIFTGASTNDHVDGALARANASICVHLIKVAPIFVSVLMLTMLTILIYTYRNWRKKCVMVYLVNLMWLL